MLISQTYNREVRSKDASPEGNIRDEATTKGFETLNKNTRAQNALENSTVNGMWHS